MRNTILLQRYVISRFVAAPVDAGNGRRQRSFDFQHSTAGQTRESLVNWQHQTQRHQCERRSCENRVFKVMDAQFMIRQEAQEKQAVLADLLKWQPEANKRTNGQADKRPVGPSLPGKQTGLAPLRGQRHDATSNQPEPSVAPFTIRESAHRASKVEEATAAKHTYDYFRTWDKFNYDEAMAEADGKRGVRQVPASQADLQHQMSNQR